MPATWTLPVQDILTDALEIVGAIGTGQTASAEDHAVALRGLQGILKELPIHGLSWPKVTSAPVSLTWDAGIPSEIALPVDYYGVPQMYYLANDSGKVNLEVLTKARYDALPDPAATAEHPQFVYIAADKTAFLYPVPTEDPGLMLTYQAIVLDATVAAPPDVAQTWIAGLGLWVANEISPKFGVSLPERQDIERRFLARRALMLAHAAETAPICISVAD
jgi:hypothetical protein